MHKEDLKCYVFIIITIILVILATSYFQYVIRFVLLIFFYWYISIPIIIISYSSIDFFSRRVLIKKAYNTINSVEIQESFKKSSGENPLKNGKITKAYKNWLIQKVVHPKIKITTRVSPKDIKGLIILIILLIVMILVFLMLYAAIFPDYRLSY